MKTNVYAVFGGFFFPLPFTQYRIHQIFAALLPLLNFADLNRRINPPHARCAPPVPLQNFPITCTVKDSDGEIAGMVRARSYGSAAVLLFCCNWHAVSSSHPCNTAAM